MISKFFEKLQPMSATAGCAISASTVSTSSCSLVGGEILSSVSRDWSSAGIGILVRVGVRVRDRRPVTCLASEGGAAALRREQRQLGHAAGWRRGSELC